MISLESHPQGTLLPVRAQPGAKRSAIIGEYAGALRVAVTAVADKGKANQAIVSLLSKAFGLPKSAVELVGGVTSRQKRFLLRGMSLESAEKLVDRFLANAQDSS